jgi:hypothetical protein
MPEWLRVGGSGFGSDGPWVAWSVAEGSRGRRWREARSTDGGMVTSLLLETDTSGRFAHLELSTTTGLLTLHPEGDGSLHGHAVVGGEHSVGVEPVPGLTWQPDGLVIVEGSTICQLAAIHLLGRSLPEFSAVSQPAVAIHPTLACQPTVVRVERITRDRWRFGGDPPIDVEERGLPLLRDGEMWPLELSD